MDDPHEVVAVARYYLGTPFRHQGRTPDVGLDCVGLLIQVAKDIGHPWTDVKGYSRHPSGDILVKILDEYCVRESGPAVGRIVAFEHLKGLPYHVGIITDNEGKFGLIHTWANVKKVVEHAWTVEHARAAIGYWSWRK